MQQIIQFIAEYWKSFCTLVGTGIVAFFYKRIKIWIVGVFDKGKTLFNIDERTKKSEKDIEEVKNSILDVRKQLFPNGGSSLPDSQKRIEETLKIISNKIDSNDRSIWAVTGSLSFRTDVQGKVINVSQKLLNLLGVGEEDFAGDRWFNLVDPKQSMNLKITYKKYVETGLNFEEDFLFIRKSDNAHINVRLTLNTLRNSAREITNFVGEIKQL